MTVYDTLSCIDEVCAHIKLYALPVTIVQKSENCPRCAFWRRAKLD